MERDVPVSWNIVRKQMETNKLKRSLAFLLGSVFELEKIVHYFFSKSVLRTLE